MSRVWAKDLFSMEPIIPLFYQHQFHQFWLLVLRFTRSLRTSSVSNMLLQLYLTDAWMFDCLLVCTCKISFKFLNAMVLLWFLVMNGFILQCFIYTSGTVPKLVKSVKDFWHLMEKGKTNQWKRNRYLIGLHKYLHGRSAPHKW